MRHMTHFIWHIWSRLRVKKFSPGLYPLTGLEFPFEGGEGHIPPPLLSLPPSQLTGHILIFSMAAVRDISDTSLYCSQPAFINTFRTIQEIVSIPFTTAEASLYSPRFYYFCVRQFMSTYFFRPVLASLLSLSIYLSIQGRMGCQERDRERK